MFETNIGKYMFGQCWTNVWGQYGSHKYLANVDPILAGIQYWLAILAQQFMFVVSQYYPNIGQTMVANIAPLFAVNTNQILRVKIGQMLGQCLETNISKYIFGQCWGPIY